MRLLNTQTLEFEEFAGSAIPDYAILSHTWEKNEVSFQEMRNLGTSTKHGYQKIQETCRLASTKGLKYAWLDTCCIDKSSSSELSEAINSMFEWYRRATICIVYLSDLHLDDPNYQLLKACRWFTRGWTLQELIAPEQVEFYNANWTIIGSKLQLKDHLQRITGVNEKVLQDSTLLASISVSTKMSWAAHRETTRTEDIAYCLLGIFNVSMPLIYGEGEKAFYRLQEEVIRATHDITIFAWKSHNTSQVYEGILASSPMQFASPPHTMQISKHFNTDGPEFSVTNKGVRFLTRLMYSESIPGLYILPIEHKSSSPTANMSKMGILLAKFASNSFVRAHHDTIYEFETSTTYERTDESVIYVLKAATPNTSKSVRLLRQSAIQFKFDQAVRIMKVIPESLWDHHRRSFLLPSPASSWAILYYDRPGICSDSTPWKYRYPSIETNYSEMLICFLLENRPVCYNFYSSTTSDKDVIIGLLESATNLNRGVDNLDRIIQELDLGLGLRLNETKRWFINSVPFNFRFSESDSEDTANFALEVKQASSEFGDSCHLM